MSRRPRVLSVAGVDPCGGAGVLADVRSIAIHGGEPAAVPACTTVQNRHGFGRAVAVDAREFAAMLEAVAADGPIDAIKTGMLGAPGLVAVLAAFVDRRAPQVPLVVDPVLSATAGGGDARLVDIAGQLRELLLPRAIVVTPNLPELQVLAGGDPDALLRLGARAVLVKGGHGSGPRVVDRLFRRVGDPPAWEDERPRIARGPVHGTGCALSAALATALADGDELVAATARACGWVARCLAATPASIAGRPEPLRLVPARRGI